MISEIHNLPDHIAGFEGHGYISGIDYESVLMPTVEDKLLRNGILDLLYHLPEDVIAFETTALWDDLKLSLFNRKRWGRVAMVTDLKWMPRATRWASRMLPGEVRLFSNEELADARNWLMSDRPEPHLQ